MSLTERWVRRKQSSEFAYHQPDFRRWIRKKQLTAVGNNRGFFLLLNSQLSSTSFVICPTKHQPPCSTVKPLLYNATLFTVQCPMVVQMLKCSSVPGPGTFPTPGSLICQDRDCRWLIGVKNAKKIAANDRRSSPDVEVINVDSDYILSSNSVMSRIADD